MPRILITHSQRDADLAASVRAALARLGIDAFDPARDISATENWRAAIKSAIAGADAVVAVIGSPEAAASSWVGYDVGMAEALGKPVLVLASHDYSVAELPADISSYRVIPFDPGSPDAAARVIALSLRQAA